MKIFPTLNKQSGRMLLLLGFCLLTNKVSAQAPFSTFIQNFKSDGNKILKAYNNPFLKRHGDGWSDG